jgi:hypothetical protein
MFRSLKELFWFLQAKGYTLSAYKEKAPLFRGVPDLLV